MSVDIEQRDHIVIITLNRPEARNAFNPEQTQALEQALDDFEANIDLRCAVLTGTGEVFSAGADLKEIAAGNALKLATIKGGFAGITKRERTKPVIGAINGPALAGGCEVALACDLLVASETASFGLPEVKRALVAAAGGLIRLPRAVGQSAAMEAILTGEPIPAQRAFELGMISRLVSPDQVLPTAVDLAEKIAANAPLAVYASRGLVARSFGESDEQLWNDSYKAMASMFATEDFREGPRAFVEKRAPVWKGK